MFMYAKSYDIPIYIYIYIYIYINYMMHNQENFYAF